MSWWEHRGTQQDTGDGGEADSVLADEMLAAVDHVLDVYASFVQGKLSLAPSCVVRVNNAC